MARKGRSRKSNEKLEPYRGKRDFERTAEPSGGETASSPSGRLFIVQKHAARNLHYDFRLEFDGVLKSWAVPKGPSLDPRIKPLAVEVEDHPIEYGSFEGIIPKGEYGGGTVMLWDRGEWEPIGDEGDGYDRGDLKFRLHGEKLRGDWVLARMQDKSGKATDGRNWLLIKKKDGESRSIESYNVLGEAPLSVASGRTLDEIAADPEAVWTDGRAEALDSKNPRGHRGRVADDLSAAAAALTGARADVPLPDPFSPQLAVVAAEPPEGEDWLHEIKLDGYRLMCRIDDGAVRLLTRNGHDWTDRFGDVARAAARLPIDDAIIDGEVVVLDPRGISDFGALQNAFRGRGSGRFVYYVFDVPFAAGCDLRRTPLVERKAYLERVIAAAPLAAPVVRYCDHIVGSGPTVYDEAAAAGLEGIISKRAASTYESRRSPGWLKVKCTLRQEFVIGGWTAPSGSRSGFGALLIGCHDDDRGLVYCGRVGTGFTDRLLDDLARQLAVLGRDTSPFVNAEEDPDHRTVHWVEPELVGEVEFTAWTNDDKVRHATWRGLRLDVEPGDVDREPAPSNPSAGRGATADQRAAKPRGYVKAGGSPSDSIVAGIRISHPERTVYPEDGVTKRDVAVFYERIAEWVLPHVTGRPLSLVRCPLGLAGEAFYQREVGEGFPASIRGVEIGDDHAIVIDGLDGLLALVQMGVLEIHAWGCRADRVERPDHLVFDLDPGAGIEWEHVVASACFVRDRLAAIGLRSFVKTTGGNGLHVVVPIARRAPWDEAKAFTKAVADHIVRLAPRNFVATMSKSRREHRVFVDYLRNQRGSTSVAAYSTRARAGATVSTPLTWDELSPKDDAGAYTVLTVPPRLESIGDDPWVGFDSVRQSITKRMIEAVSP